MTGSRGSDAALAVLAVLIGLFACLLVQGECFEIETELRGRPVVGTARAAYCGPIDHWYRWLLFPVVALILAGAISRLLRSTRHARAIAAVVLVAVAFLNAGYVGSLTYFFPGP